MLTVTANAVRGASDRGIVSNGRPADDEPDVEVEDPRDGDEASNPRLRYAIHYYGADFSVKALLKRLERGDLLIPDGQRFRWTIPQASKFIESLVLNLPIPGIFLFEEPDTKKYMVADGQQRLLSLKLFHRGTLHGRPFRLQGVTQELDGRTWDRLQDLEREDLERALIHAVIFRQIYPDDDRSAVYEVVERLNLGRVGPGEQELRNRVYRGPFVRLLSELNDDANWRRLFGPRHRRKKDEELILRFLALHDDLDAYHPPMKHFLNRFMARHRNLSDREANGMRSLFIETVEVVSRVLTPELLRRQGVLNAAVVEAVLVGAARRLAVGAIEDESSLATAHRAMMEVLEAGCLHHGSATHPDRLRERIGVAAGAFASAQ